MPHPQSQSNTPGKIDLNDWLKEKGASTGDVLYFTRIEYSGLPVTPLVGIVIDRTDGEFAIISPGGKFFEDDRRIIPLSVFRLDYRLDGAIEGSDVRLRFPARLLSDEARQPELSVIDGRRA